MYAHAKSLLRGCPECGSSPTSHLVAWLSSTVDITFQGAEQHPPSAWSRAANRAVHFFKPVLSWLYQLATLTRLVTYSDDLAHAPSGRFKIVWEEARRRGIPMRQLRVLGYPSELFEAEVQGRKRVFQSLPLPPADTELSWPDDKYALKKKYKAERVAAPVSYSVTTFDEALHAFTELGVVCVKPRTGSNGRHTFPYVTTKEDLAAAFRSAKKLCKWVVVEEHLEGNLARATCVGGVLVGFLESEYPAVVGDGRSTIAELIAKENLRKPARVADIQVTSVHEAYIARRGYMLTSILEAGKTLPLVYWAGYNSGGRNTEYGTAIHEELRAEIERAAKLTGLPVVGFDLIISDPTKTPSAQAWGIIEANSLPWIDLHSKPLYGTPVNVAVAVWDLWGSS